MSAKDAACEFDSCNVILAAWPRQFLYDALAVFQGEKFIFVGETDDGCTASINDGDFGFKLEGEIELYRSYAGINDKVLLYSRE